jgi:hypothetical protein
MLKSMLLQSLYSGGRNDFKGIVDLVKNEAIVWHDDTQGATFDVVAILRMLDEVKRIQDLFLLKRLLIMMKICWRNSWKMKTHYRGKNQQNIRAALLWIWLSFL